MPELPDLEVFVENLKPKVLNKEITQIEVLKEKVIKNAYHFEAHGAQIISDNLDEIIGYKITSITRRAKYLIFSLKKTSISLFLLIHLKLHGELYYLKDRSSLPSFPCLILTFSDATALCFSDRTQWMGIGISKTIPGNLGIEPLSNDFTLVRFRELLSRNQRSVIKPFLITQELVAGIGNAFADEILWEAQLYPKRKISSLSPKEIEKLHLAIRKVLQEAIPQIKREIKGGITGEIRSFLSIHGKDKKQCPRCQTKTATEKIGGRVSYFCPKCQKS